MHLARPRRPLRRRGAGEAEQPVPTSAACFGGALFAMEIQERLVALLNLTLSLPLLSPPVSLRQRERCRWLCEAGSGRLMLAVNKQTLAPECSILSIIFYFLLYPLRPLPGSPLHSAPVPGCVPSTLSDAPPSFPAYSRLSRVSSLLSEIIFFLLFCCSSNRQASSSRTLAYLRVVQETRTGIVFTFNICGRAVLNGGPPKVNT